MSSTRRAAHDRDGARELTKGEEGSRSMKNGSY
jgi:hypothetical protein